MSDSNAPPAARATNRALRPRWALVYSVEIAIIVSAAVLAFLLRFDSGIPAFYVKVLLKAIAVWIPVKLALFKLLGLDHRWARYVSIPDLSRLAVSNAIASCLSMAILVFVRAGVPRTIYAIDLLVT